MTIFARFYRSNFFKEILIPFLLTRALLVLVGMTVFALALPINPEFSSLGIAPDHWYFSPYPLVDMWMRWDTGWYLRVASIGYADQANLGTAYTSLAFFPMYPGLVRVLLHAVGVKITQTSFGLAGILVSNISLLAGLYGLRNLATDLLGKPGAGRWAVWWALVFPVSFFFSAVYTESIWFAFTIFSLSAASRNRWLLAGVLGACAVLTRAQGILILLPLGWLYMEARRWNFLKLDHDIAWLALPGVAILGWFAALYPLTGSWIAPVIAQGGWGRAFGWPWQSLFMPNAHLGMITILEQVFMSIGLALSFYALWRAGKKSEGALSPAYILFALTLLLLPLFSGSTLSGLRFLLPAFPVFIIAAGLSLPDWLKTSLGALFFALQVYLFGLWCLFYWVG